MGPCAQEADGRNLRGKVAAGGKAGAEEAVASGLQAQQRGGIGRAQGDQVYQRGQGLPRHARAVCHAHLGRPGLMQQPAAAAGTLLHTLSCPSPSGKQSAISRQAATVLHAQEGQHAGGERMEKGSTE